MPKTACRQGKAKGAGDGAGKSFGLKALSAAMMGALALMGGHSTQVLGATGSCAGVNGLTVDNETLATSCGLEANETLTITSTGIISQPPVGVFVDASATSVFIVNQGTIDGATNGVGNDGEVSQIDNSGTMEGGVNGVINAGQVGEIVNRSGGVISADTYGIQNSGTITTINNQTAGSITGLIRPIYNTGTITELNNAGTISTLSTVAIQNNGTIVEINNQNGGVIDGGIRNNGSITTINNEAGAVIRGGANGIIDNNGSTDTLNNSGVIEDFVQLAGTTVNILGNQARFTGVVSSPTGSINIRSGADFTAENNFDAATFLIESGGRLRVSGTAYSLSVGNPSADAFNNAGTLDVAEGLEARITGNYTQSGTLRIGASSTTSYGQLRVTGNAVLTGSARFEVDVNTTNTLAAGQTLAGVVSATGTLTNSAPANNVSDNSYLFDFESSTNGNSVDLQIVAATSAPVASPSPAPPRPRPSAPATSAAPPAPAGIVPAVLQNNLINGVPAANVLDGFIRGGATGTDFDAVVTALGRLPNARSVAQAVGQTMPALHGNAPAMLMSLGSSTSLAVQQQLQGDGAPTASLQQPSGANFGSGGGAGGRSDSGQGLWVKALGNRLNQDTVDGASGYKLSTYGLMGGLQSELNASTTLGFGLGYLDSDVAGQDFAAGQSSDIESVQLVGYGQYAIGDAGWQLNWQGDFTRSRVESERNITFIGRTAQAKYNGDAWHLGVGISKAYTVNPTTTVQPSVALDWRSFKAEGYTETGAGALNLQVNEQTAQEAVLKVGAQVQQQLTPQTQWLASAALGYDLRDQRDAVTARFTGGGVAFTTEGLPASRTIGELGLGIRHQASNGLELVARYDLRLREGLRDQTASVRVNWAF